MEHYDAIVIGTGQAGKPLATRLAEAGMQVAIVERRDRIGGTCVLDGCTPTKTMVASARAASVARDSRRWGVDTGPVQVDLAAVRDRKRKVVSRWSEGAEASLRDAEGVEVVHGHARFTGERDGEGRHRLVVVQGDDRRGLSAPRIFINTGTRPRVPAIPGIDAVDWYDNGSIMELDEVPSHLVVLGGGFVGVEFAQMFRRFGAQVTIVEAGDRLVPREDPDVADGVREILEGDGVGVQLNTRAARVAPVSKGVRIHVRTGEGVAGDDGPLPTLDASHLLVAVGRVPNADDVGADAVGLTRSDSGHIVVNDRLETDVEGVWALGDVNGGAPFTHVSYDDFRIVAANVLGTEPPERGHGASTDAPGRAEPGATRSGRVLPYTLFIDPPLGRVGLTEAAAREAGHDVRVAKLDMSQVARAVEIDETRGFMKAVVDAVSERILGAAILGVDGGEVATVIQVAMMGGLPWTALRDGVFSHPTTGESLNGLFAEFDAG